MQQKNHRILVIATIFLIGTVGNAWGDAIVNLNLNPALAGNVPDPTGFSFASSVIDNSTPAFGTPERVLGLPDNPGGVNGFMTDFNGQSGIHGFVTLGFDIPIVNALGIDMKIFGTQLDEVEGLDVFLSADGTNFTQVASFLGSPSGQLNSSTPFVVEIDFNDVAIPTGAQFARLVAEIPGGTSPFGFDMDAIGVTTSEAVSAVPEPSSIFLMLCAIAMLSFSPRTAK